MTLLKPMTLLTYQKLWVNFFTMRVISVMNSKGGACKTTTAVNTAAAVAEQGHRCLLIDLDPSANASIYLGVPDGGKDFLGALVSKVLPTGSGADS